MKDQNCTPFLQWSLPRLRMRWPGFRKVRGQVCKRIGRRLRELGLADVSDYRAHLEHHPEEWTVLDALCRKTEDRGKVDFLVQDVRKDPPGGLCHIIFCRNLAFTYFDVDLQHDVLARVGERLIGRGALVIGIHESLPAEHRPFMPWPGSRSVFRKMTAPQLI